jgi:aspartyl-tRNA(Asn)/glutamyl-tRNA(Gln) amidotransferase subunit B
MGENYFVTIGMEVHCELKTNSKMWCECKNESLPDEANKNVCEICLAEPGSLPYPNIKAIESMIKIGLAINGNIANFSEFDRKNYFYPDIPKGYQITQFKYPIVSGGILANIPITRIHLEEDTAKSDHSKGDYTLIDFNRAGVPLMELVTEPVTYENSEEAALASSQFGKTLQRLLRNLGVSDADMERGEMRLEANISITKDKNVFGTKCEVKNLNSFNSVYKAIKYEVSRHAAMLAEGKTIIQETRGWDEIKNETFSQRKKENANDYRYFPDPDLPKMYLHNAFDLDMIRSTLPELEDSMKKRYFEIGLSTKQIDQLLDDTTLSEYYDNASKYLANNEDKKTLANYLLTDAVGLLAKDIKLKLPKPENFSTLIAMISGGKLSSRGAKDLLLKLLQEDGDVETMANTLGLIQNNNKEDSIRIVEQVKSEFHAEWDRYKSGEVKLEMFFVGKCMAASKGTGNPKIFIEIIKSL